MDKETAAIERLYKKWTRKQLSEDVRKRYEEKLQKIGLAIDPYSPQELRNLKVVGMAKSFL